jgi:hypothetical protein
MQITIMVHEHKTTGLERIGHLSIDLAHFGSVKMQKFSLQHCFDSSAFMEAFLLRLPVRIE